MQKFLFLVIIVFSFLSCTKELEDNLINVDTWKWSHSKTIFGTNINVTETKEISFRNNTLIDLVISNQKDTLLYHKSNIVWNTTFLKTIKILEEGNIYETKLEVEEYNRLVLRLSGFSTVNKSYKFTPKYN